MTEFLGVHLVGSMQASNADEVFQTIGKNLGAWVRRISDGDIGVSRRWLFNEWRHYVESGFFEEYEEPTAVARLFTRTLRLKPGVRADEIELPSLNYATNARESYPTFARRRADGTIPKDSRFMVCLPSPRTSAILLETHSGEAARSAHGVQLRATIAELAEIVPAGELAIQWDVVRETREALTPELMADLALLADWVPQEVEVGYHLCFGDRKSRGDMAAKGMREQGMTLTPIMETHERTAAARTPFSNGMTILRDMSNGIIERASRSIEFFHLAALAGATMPLNDAYAALTELNTRRGTEFYLGILDIDSGLEGTRHQLEEAAKVLPRFGIGPECGLQRLDPDEYRLALATLRTLAEELSA